MAIPSDVYSFREPSDDLVLGVRPMEKFKVAHYPWLAHLTLLPPDAYHLRLALWWASLLEDPSPEIPSRWIRRSSSSSKKR